MSLQRMSLQRVRGVQRGLWRGLLNVMAIVHEEIAACQGVGVVIRPRLAGTPAHTCALKAKGSIWLR